MKKISETEKRKAHSLFTACFAGDLDGVKLILSKNFHTCDGDFTKEEWRHSDIDIDPKSWGRRPIHVSTIAGHLDIVKFLVQNGAKINTKNRFGDTAVHFAVHHNRYQILNYLLENGANPLIKNNIELTAIDVAKDQNKLNLVEEMNKTRKK